MFVEMIKNPSFSIKVSVERKILFCTVFGLYSSKEAGESIVAYKEGVSMITPAETDLVINCEELVITSPDILHLLEACFKIYIGTGFRSVQMWVSEGKEIRGQIQGLIDKLGANFVFIDNFEE